MFDIKNKVVLITGGSNGIGAATVEIFLENKAKQVTVLDIDASSLFKLEEKLSNTFDKSKVKFIKCDITKDKELYEVFDSVQKENGQIDIVINNAAIGQETMDTYKTLIDVNYHVAILDIAEDAGIAFQNELNSKYGNNKVHFIKCDVSNAEQLNAAFAKVKDEFSYIDIVINNAGILNDNLQTYVKQIDINVTALVTSSLKALELMRKDEGGKGGVVINVSSIAAICAVPDTPIYSATKAAVLKFTTAMGSDLYFSRTGVRFLTVCFGATNTPLLSAEKMGSFDSEVEAGIVDTLKKLKWQSPESAARGVVDTYKNGSSGSVWLITGDKPAVEVTDLYNKGIGLFDHLIYS